MKKIIVISTLLLMTLVGTAFALNLEGVAGVELSNGVTGTYFSNAATDATAFAISTGHKQGGFVYGTGSFTTAIWRTASSDPFVATDLLSTAPSSWDEAAAFPDADWDAI